MGDANDAFMRNNQGAVQARTKAANRANVLELKMIGQSHPTGLTPNLLKLFEPRPPLEYKRPPEKRKCPAYSGMAQFVAKFAEPTDPEYAPPVPKVETPAEKKARIHQLRLEKGAAKAAEELEKYDPGSDPNATGDPYKTLFVARLSYETTESRLKREFETYGPIKRVKMVFDQESNKPRGYAFIEYAHTRDMKSAYKQGDGRKIDGRRVLVDVERGRTVPNWRPRRLGGGLGTTRAGGEDAGQRPPSREVQSAGVSRSQEPRVRDDSSLREKSRERGGRDKEREREKSRERSHDRPRERDHREDRHHRDRDRTRDKDRDRDRTRDREHRDRDRTRDRDRGRDRGRDHERERGRDRDREHRPRERDTEREYEGGEVEYDYRAHSRDRDYEFDRADSKNAPEKRGYDHGEDEPGWYDQAEHGGSRHQGRKDYDQPEEEFDRDRYNQYPDRYEQKGDDYKYDRAE